jgi:hypothetical protein
VNRKHRIAVIARPKSATFGIETDSMTDAAHCFQNRLYFFQGDQSREKHSIPSEPFDSLPTNLTNGDFLIRARNERTSAVTKRTGPRIFIKIGGHDLDSASQNVSLSQYLLRRDFLSCGIPLKKLPGSV